MGKRAPSIRLDMNLLFILGHDETVFFAKRGQIIAYIDSTM